MIPTLIELSTINHVSLARLLKGYHGTPKKKEVHEAKVLRHSFEWLSRQETA